ncbi:hypothetical protein K505DRAFT_339020 [Melanomma pulvis-pyrius CBS 109.77]|uniref:Uncharacterized protein n=1 Tax=Melanomma pulvis-pyrius CBS 109.77 TaxID=1314802 RepID=A0A6A6X6U4_9PLEO|nr:hypothetical protein K505DRAFT_339020 [Melanomma pulvis-pyrius CBS 109.77]
MASSNARRDTGINSSNHHSFNHLMVAIESDFQKLEVGDEAQCPALILNRAWGAVMQPQRAPHVLPATTRGGNDTVALVDSPIEFRETSSSSVTSLTEATFPFSIQLSGSGEKRKLPTEDASLHIGPPKKKARRNSNPSSSNTTVRIAPYQDQLALYTPSGSATGSENLEVPFIFQHNKSIVAPCPHAVRDQDEIDWEYAKRGAEPDRDGSVQSGVSPPQYHIAIYSEPMEPTSSQKKQLPKSVNTTLLNLVCLNNRKYRETATTNTFSLREESYSDAIIYMVDARHCGDLPRAEAELKHCLDQPDNHLWEAIAYGVIETVMTRNLNPIKLEHSPVGWFHRQEFVRKLFHSICVANFPLAQKRHPMSFCWNSLRSLAKEKERAILGRSTEGDKGSVLLYNLRMNRNIEEWRKEEKLCKYYQDEILGGAEVQMKKLDSVDVSIEG